MQHPIHIYEGIFAVKREMLLLIVPVGTVDSYVNRGKLESVGHGTYTWDSLPSEWKSAYSRIYLDGMTVDGWYTEKVVGTTLNTVRLRYYRKEDVTYFLNRGIKDEYAREYAVAASWLRMLKELNSKSEITALGIAGIAKKSELRATTARAINLKHWVANTERVLQVKELEFAKGGLDTIPTKKIGNNNALRITEEVRKLILGIYVGTGRVKRMPHQVLQEYLQVVGDDAMYVEPESGEVFGTSGYPYPELSLSSVKSLLSHPSVIAATSRMVHGSKWHNDFVLPYIHGKPPKYALSMTSSDGETSPFRLLDAKGNVTYKRPTAYLVFDVASQAIIGFSLGASETLELMKFAFRDMLLTTKGKVPFENQLDNYGQGMKATLGEIFQYVSFCQPYHPQSKYAEPFIKAFEQQCLRKDEAFVGGNIQDKKQVNKPNPDLDAVGYTLEQQYKIYRHWIKVWNESVPEARNTKLTRWQILEQQANEKCSVMTYQEIAHIVGERTVASIHRFQISIKFNKKVYSYMLSDIEGTMSRLRNGKRVAIRFIPEDMSKVYIYNFGSEDNPSQDSLLCEGILWQDAQRSKAERTTDDDRIMAEQQTYLARVARYIGTLEQGISRLDAYAEEAEITEIPTPSIETEINLPDDADAVILDGYSSKPAMQEAESCVTPILKLSRWDAYID